MEDWEQGERLAALDTLGTDDPRLIASEASRCFTEIFCGSCEGGAADTEAGAALRACATTLLLLTDFIAHDTLDALASWMLAHHCPPPGKPRAPSTAPVPAAPPTSPWATFPFGFFGDIWYRNVVTGEVLSPVQYNQRRAAGAL